MSGDPFDGQPPVDEEALLHREQRLTCDMLFFLDLLLKVLHENTVIKVSSRSSREPFVDKLIDLAQSLSKDTLLKLQLLLCLLEVSKVREWLLLVKILLHAMLELLLVLKIHALSELDECLQRKDRFDVRDH